MTPPKAQPRACLADTRPGDDSHEDATMIAQEEAEGEADAEEASNNIPVVGVHPQPGGCPVVPMHADLRLMSLNDLERVRRHEHTPDQYYGSLSGDT